MADPAQSGPAAAAPDPGRALIVDIEGYEGPLDLLLNLARTQKVDLRRLSILALAEQYLAFIEGIRAQRIELAADYLVMAAWLAYLKSRLLLPPDPAEDGPSSDEMAAHLAFQLERLAAMRQAAADLMARNRRGRDFFARGIPEPIESRRTLRWTASLLDLMQGYARVRSRDAFRPYAFDRRDICTMESALERMRAVLGTQMGWARLEDFLPEEWRGDPRRRRSATAAHFAAALELARQGRLGLRQSALFAPIEIGPGGTR